jgi:2-polyprenyl-6-methoxyphenol hydroxylase-like FAD-dependent oxidoreductase
VPPGAANRKLFASIETRTKALHFGVGMDLAGRRVGIVGAGVGGLSAALALSRHGADVQVFERAHQRRREGIALLVWANAMRALGKLGVYEAVRARSTPIEVTEVRNPRGDVLARLPIGAWTESPEPPTVAVRRPDLLAALAQAVGSDRVRIGATFSSYRVRGDIVIARFADGEEIELDALVGADGINSAVRAQLLGDGPARSANQHAWVGVARDVAHLVRAGISTATIGRGPRFWTAALDHGAAFWFATLHDPLRGAEHATTDLGREYASWHAPIGELIAATRDEEIAYTQIFDRPPSDRWGAGPVTLLGDAAHASTPDLGQGACQAIESAVVLGHALERAKTIADGLRSYERLRMERTATISRLCWLTSLNSTARNPAVCGVRDTVVRLGLPAIARGPLTWILAGQEC